MRYRKKPVKIEAILWTGENQREMFDFLTDGKKVDDYMTASGDTFYIDHNKVKGGLVIKTLEGEHIASIGDYIIKGVAGEFYPCKPEIFEQTYETLEPVTSEGIENQCSKNSFGPIEVFKSQEELNECLEWWKHRLYLDGWIIRAKVVDEIEDCNGEDMDDVVGLNTYKYEVSQSYIQILSEASFEQKNPYCEHICMEKTLVHELLHCIYNWLDGGESYESVYLMAKEHQQIEQMAKSFVMAKYNLNYDYFEKG
jgi:hypothetical protein